MDRIVGEVVLGPQIVAADDGLASIHDDELAVVPRKAVAGFEDGAGPHRRDADRDTRSRNVPRRVGQLLEKGRCVHALGRKLADQDTDLDSAAAEGQFGDGGAQRGGEAPRRRRLQLDDVDALPRTGDEIVNPKRERIGVPETDFARGGAKARGARPDRAAGAALAVGIRAAGRQRDVGLAILAAHLEPGEIVTLAPPAVGCLHQPVDREAVAARQVVGDAVENSGRVALGQLALQLQQGIRCGQVGRPDAAIANQGHDGSGRPQDPEIAFRLAVADSAAGQVAAAGTGHDKDQQQGKASEHGQGLKRVPD